MRETFGQRLARLRKKKGLTQEDVANRITISPQAVSKWENDLSSPDILVLSSLADILGVSVDELLGRQTSSNAEEKEPEQEETKEKDDDVAAEVADKPNASEGIHLTNDGIHIVDDEGERINVSDKGIYVRQKDGKTKRVDVKCRYHRKPWFISTAVLMGLALIGYIVMGLLWTDKNMGWSMGWILFLIPIIVGSIYSAVRYRRFTNFAYPILIVGAYCTLGFLGGYFGFPGWTFYWFLFLTIPAFYLIFGPIDSHIHRYDHVYHSHWIKDDDDEDDDGEDKVVNKDE